MRISCQEAGQARLDRPEDGFKILRRQRSPGRIKDAMRRSGGGLRPSFTRPAISDELEAIGTKGNPRNLLLFSFIRGFRLKVYGDTVHSSHDNS